MDQIRTRLQEYNIQLKFIFQKRPWTRPLNPSFEILPDERAVNLQLLNFGEQFSILMRARSLIGWSAAASPAATPGRSLKDKLNNEMSFSAQKRKDIYMRKNSEDFHI